jgi:hypothetical protein
MLDGTYFVPSDSPCPADPLKGRLDCGPFYEPSPDENGEIDMAIEEYTIDPIRRPLGLPLVRAVL